MSNTAATPKQPSRPVSRRTLVVAAAVVAVVAAIALDTTVVQIGSEHDVRQAVFSKESFGAEHFPKIQENVISRAVDGATLAKEIAADKKAAGTKYGVASSVGPVIPVRFTGLVGEHKGNMHFVAVEGLPPELVVRVQTGPAINGMDLRDSTGTIEFGQFTNQIEYQDAGSGINNEMKKQVLAAIDPNALTGKTIEVTGVFKLVNVKSWLVTPVKIEVR